MEDMMKTFLNNRMIRQLVVLAVLLLMVTWTATVSATTPTTPTIDGTIGADWDANENMGASGPTGSGNPQLWLTWDNNNLYVGIQGDPDTAIQIFFDVAPGGAMLDTNNLYTIATTGGYEYAWRVPHGANHTAASERWFSFSPVPGWGTGVVASTAGIVSGYGSDLELAIPWTALGQTSPPAANTRLGVLVTIGPSLAGGNVTNYWPNVAGNTISPAPFFTQQFIFDNAGASGVVTGSSPTAVSLQSFSANSANHWLAFSGLLILLGGSGLALLRRRQPRA